MFARGPGSEATDIYDIYGHLRSPKSVTLYRCNATRYEKLTPVAQPKGVCFRRLTFTLTTALTYGRFPARRGRLTRRTLLSEIGQ
jgi:hypothetical protein